MTKFDIADFTANSWPAFQKTTADEPFTTEAGFRSVTTVSETTMLTSAKALDAAPTLYLWRSVTSRWRRFPFDCWYESECVVWVTKSKTPDDFFPVDKLTARLFHMADYGELNVEENNKHEARAFFRNTGTFAIDHPVACGQGLAEHAGYPAWKTQEACAI